MADSTPTRERAATQGTGDATAATIRVHNPATGEDVGSVAVSTRDEVAAAVARARAAQHTWAALPWSERARVVRRFHDALLDGAGDMLDTIQSESGKARRDAFGELLTMATTARYYLAHGRRHLKTSRARAAFPLITSARLERLPVGVVGLVTPWNYPLLLAMGDAIPALLAGNTVVAKPSELTPLTAERTRELLVGAGLPPDVLQLVHGTGPEAGDELLRHVDYIGFTGSTATGRIVAQAAAARLVPCSLELGGKNPMIVLEGANLDDAVAGLLNGAFFNTGQTCIAIERVYVQESIRDEFVARAVAATRRLRLGWSTGWDMDVGSLVSVEHADRVEAHVRDAVAHGATVEVGGQRRRDLGDTYFEPTILTGVTTDMLASCDETFGPVVSIYAVRDAEEALARANDSDYGLNGSVWAGSRREAGNIASRLRVGTVGINSALLAYTSLDVPMGGIGQSGIGRRHGAEGIRRYTHPHTVVRSVGWKGGYESITQLVTSDRRAGILTTVFRLWRRIPGLR